MLLTGLQGYFHFTIMGVHHASFALATIILYLFTETLVMFYFIGTGVNIKEYLREESGDPALYEKVKKGKMVVFPKMMTSIFLVGITFILGGAVERSFVRPWVHGVLFLIAIVYYARLIVFEHRCFRDHTNIILEMCGVERPAPPPTGE